MEERVWRFEFVNAQQGETSSGIGGGIGSGINERPNTKTDRTQEQFVERFNEKMTGDVLRQTIGTPLNSALGRVATPLYNTGKRIVHGQAVGRALGTLGVQLTIIGIQGAINALEARLEEVRKKANAMNDMDNALIRAGSVTKATYYEGNVFGIKKKTNRG